MRTATIRVNLSGAMPGLSGMTLSKNIQPEPAHDRSYDIAIGPGVLASLGQKLCAFEARRCVIIADAAVLGSHAAQAEAILRAAGIDVTALAVPAGEASKSVSEASRLWNALAQLAVDRSTHIVAVGGGVVGDLAGFVAATFARGLPLWHVPTTLVAQVDSGIGGKTGINLEAGKNLVGGFWQPRGVVADTNTLATLPNREFTSGLAEVVKYGMILDADFFSWLESHVQAILARNGLADHTAALVHIVERSASIKGSVVEQDEHELSGLRAVLNYGHTFAHAFETAAGYGTLLHGEAVAIGMVAAARLAQLLGRIGPDVVARQTKLLQALGLATRSIATEQIPAERLIDIMARDKKTLHGRLRFVLPTRIGHAELVTDVDPAAVRESLRPE